MVGITLVRGTRFPGDPDVPVYGLKLKYRDVIEVRWPGGRTDIMTRMERAPGTYDTEADGGERPGFWVRSAYQDYGTMIRETGRNNRWLYGDGAGDPFPIPDAGELGPDGGLDPWFWGRE